MHYTTGQFFIATHFVWNVNVLYYSSMQHNNLEVASLLVRSKPYLIRIGIVAVAIFEIFLLLYILFQGYRIANEFSFFKNSYNGFYAASNAARNVLTQGKVPTILGVTTLERGTASIDAVALLENQNSDWILTVSSGFSTTDGFKAAQDIVIPPQSKRVVGVFGLDASLSGAQFQVTRVAYQRVSSRDFGDIAKYTKERLQFVFGEEQYISSSGDQNFDKLQVSVTNNSPYNFYDVGVQAVMYSDSQILGFEQVSLSNFISGQTRTLDIHSLPRGIAPSRVEFIPVVNIFDAKTFLKVEG